MAKDTVKKPSHTFDLALQLTLLTNVFSISSMVLFFRCSIVYTSVFDAPTLAEPAACQSKGSLPQKIQLTNALEVVSLDDQFSSGNSIVWNSFAVVLCMLGSFLFI